MSGGRVLLTGATGFIGSHLAEVLLAAGYEVGALRRSSSDLRRLAAVQDQLVWINSDDPSWETQLLAWQPGILVHAAWLGGVSAGQRDDWLAQLTNLDFLLRLLELLAQGPLRQVVALGSQAEYGAFEGRVDEAYPPRPTSAYGAVKLAALQVVRTFCETRGLSWQWLRIFAAFGPREDRHWFVSHIITSLLAAEKPLEMTPGEQRYDYSHVRDLAGAVCQVLGAGVQQSGVYNIGANAAISLRELVGIVQELTATQGEVRLGAVPYREGQVMHLEGNSHHFEHVFGPIVRTPLRPALAETIAYWRAEQSL
ncbi:NAD-dependent epimerase/dehydratase family protein [uncultured Hymenobacter sp.]|uniref:NAD-dependent epimerase/dehydratase family protein n=1 Tax=uncultured Hymenobacter sp. TaxID=170016 RepID=UPI0035CC3153